MKILEVIKIFITKNNKIIDSRYARKNGTVANAINDGEGNRISTTYIKKGALTWNDIKGV